MILATRTNTASRFAPLRSSSLPRATQLSDIFPILSQTWAGNQKPETCTHCKELGRWIDTVVGSAPNQPYFITTNRDSQTSQFYDRDLVDTITLEASNGCGNCRFMLGCLRQAAFSPESLKSPRRMVAFKHRYQLMLHHGSIQEEFLLKLESVFERSGVSHASRPSEMEIRRELRRDLDMYSYTLASCSLVICNAAGR